MLEAVSLILLAPFMVASAVICYGLMFVFVIAVIAFFSPFLVLAYVAIAVHWTYTKIKSFITTED